MSTEAQPLHWVARSQSTATRLESARCLLSALYRVGIPKTMLDLGCGGGHLVRIADALGVKSLGVDITIDRLSTIRGEPLPGGSSLLYRDLTQPWPDVSTYDLVLCLEVAEHLPSLYANTLCDTIARATSNLLLFSAAIPDQGGAGHVNEQPHAYWIEKLTDRGLVTNLDLTRDLRRDWTKVAPVAWWYGQNLIAFETQSTPRPSS